MDDPHQAQQKDNIDAMSQAVSESGEQADISKEQSMETGTQQATTPPAPEETPKWPFVLFAVLLVAALGGGWILYQRAQAPLPSPSLVPFPTPARLASPTPAPAASEDEQTRMLSTQGTSDEVSAIEADLNATNLTKLDAELKDIDQETSSL